MLDSRGPHIVVSWIRKSLGYDVNWHVTSCLVVVNLNRLVWWVPVICEITIDPAMSLRISNGWAGPRPSLCLIHAFCPPLACVNAFDIWPNLSLPTPSESLNINRNYSHHEDLYASLCTLQLWVNYAIGGDPRPTNCLSPMYPTWDGQMLVPVKPISPFMTNSYFLLKIFAWTFLPYYLWSLSCKYD